MLGKSNIPVWSSTALKTRPRSKDQSGEQASHSHGNASSVLHPWGCGIALRFGAPTPSPRRGRFPINGPPKPEARGLSSSESVGNIAALSYPALALPKTVLKRGQRGCGLQFAAVAAAAAAAAAGADPTLVDSAVTTESQGHFVLTIDHGFSPAKLRRSRPVTLRNTGTSVPGDRPKPDWSLAGTGKTAIAPDSPQCKSAAWRVAP